MSRSKFHRQIASGRLRAVRDPRDERARLITPELFRSDTATVLLQHTRRSLLSVHDARDALEISEEAVQVPTTGSRRGVLDLALDLGLPSS